MVIGLNRFKEHFTDFKDRYVLIGGTACSIALENSGLEFRVTKDLDIVLYVEALDKDFGNAFWGFIQKGNYKNLQKSTGKHLFYRFYEPKDKSYPYMLELFARKPDILPFREDSHLTPVPIDEEVSSLSAIIVDDDYYYFIRKNAIILDDVSILKEESIIPLKTRAWLDLMKRSSLGEIVDKRNINKHRNDIFRMYQLLTPESKIHLPSPIANDLRSFIDQIISDKSINLKQLGLRNIALNAMLDNLKTIYTL